jgi:hypothetical protein
MPPTPQDPHPLLTPLLTEYGVSYADFRKVGRVPRGLVEVRSAIVTRLHESGMAWAAMVEVTGLSNGSIQRLTRAKGCPAAKKNRAENAARVGHACKGKAKPALSASLKSRWARGDFNHLRGRVRTPEERSRLQSTWTPERRQHHSEIRKLLWATPAYRNGLVSFHRSPEQRVLRSHAQSARMLSDPEKWTWGRGASITGAKHQGPSTFWVRSSHEVAAVRVLEADPEVVAYLYEPRFTLADGTFAMPDFKVFLRDGTAKLVEVKAAWVLSLPTSHRKAIRLAVYRELAQAEGLPFEVWTEKDALHGYL